MPKAKIDPTQVNDHKLHVLTVGRNMRGNIKYTFKGKFDDPEAAEKARIGFIVEGKTAVIHFDTTVWQHLDGRLVKKGGSDA